MTAARDPGDEYAAVIFFKPPRMFFGIPRYNTEVRVHGDAWNALKSRWGRLGWGDGLPIRPHRAHSRLKPCEPLLSEIIPRVVSAERLGRSRAVRGKSRRFFKGRQTGE